MQKAFVLDINTCTGCEACQVACVIENRLDPGAGWRRISTFNEPHYPGLPTFHLSLACNHCIDPPCMTHCPALAYSKDPETGAVTIDPQACIGCRYCSWACPFDAPRFNRSAGLMEKCTFCHHRLKEGRVPACVEACPTGALKLEDFETSSRSDGAPGFPRTPVVPAIRFIPLGESRTAPRSTSSDATGENRHARLDRPAWPALPASKISLRGEWPLVVFTLLSALLVGWLGARRAGTGLAPLWFVGIALVAAGLSTLHLGRPSRAYRAALNWRRSWLSREIILFGFFLGAAGLCLFVAQPDGFLWGAAVVLGFTTLFAMDRVYEVTTTKGLRLHSAQVLFTGFLGLGVFSGNAGIIGPICAVKLVLYLYRKYRAGPQRREVPSIVGMSRVFFGFVLPPALWILDPANLGVAVAVTGLILGELIDRCEYYVELDVPTPGRQMVIDLDRELSRR